MMGHRLRRWPGIEPTSHQFSPVGDWDPSYPGTIWRHFAIAKWELHSVYLPCHTLPCPVRQALSPSCHRADVQSPTRWRRGDHGSYKNRTAEGEKVKVGIRWQGGSLISFVVDQVLRLASQNLQLPVLLLPLHPPVLEPDLDLSLRQAERVRHLYSAPARQVAVEVEFLLELQRLVPGVRLAAALSLWSCNKQRKIATVRNAKANNRCLC